MKKWIRDSISLAKVAATSVAVFTMVSTPLAQGAQAKATAKAAAKAATKTAAASKARAETYNYNVSKKSAQEILKLTGLGGKKRISVGEFYSKVRPYYPKTLRKDLDLWAQLNRNELMPEVQLTTYKDAAGKEQVRLLINAGKQSITASFNPDSEGRFLKINNVSLTKDDMMFHDQFVSKIYHGDKGIKASLPKWTPNARYKKSIALSYAEFSRLTPRQRAEYMVRVRYLTESAQRVMESYYGPQALNEFNREFYVRWILGQEAEAAGKSNKRKPQVGDQCIVSGYVAVYNEKLSCGGPGKGAVALKEQMEKYGGGRCSNGTISCNPLVYGYNSDGSAICVKNSGRQGPLHTATSKYCPEKSPLRKGNIKEESEDKKRIIESYLKVRHGRDDINLVFDDQGRVSEEQYNKVKDYLTELNTYIQDATRMCEVVPMSEIRQERDEQDSACIALRTRTMDLQAYPTTPVPPPVAPPRDCHAELPNSIPEGDQCVCPDGTRLGEIDEGNGPRQACVPVTNVGAGEDGKKCDAGKKPDGKGDCEDEKKWGLGWLIGGLVAIGAIFAIWKIFDKDKKDSDKQEPYDPCPPAPQICAPAPDPVAPPPVAPPPPINPPPPPPGPEDPIPTPVATPYVESTSGTSTSTSGGTR